MSDKPTDGGPVVETTHARSYEQGYADAETIARQKMGDDHYRPIIKLDTVPKMVIVTVGDKEEIYEPIISREYLEKKVLELQVLLDDQSQATGDAQAGWQASEVLQDKLITALEEATDWIERQVKINCTFRPEYLNSAAKANYDLLMEPVQANRALIAQARAKVE